MWLWGKEHRGHLSFINPRTYCSEILIPFPLGSIVKVKKYVDGNNKRTSALCPSHSDTMRDASQLFYTVSVNTSLMTQWVCHKSPEGDRWPRSLTASHEESHTVDEHTELSSVSCWLDAIPESCWTLAEQAKPSRRLLSRTHPDSYQLPEDCNVMAELLMNFLREKNKKSLFLTQITFDILADLAWQDSTAFDISLIQSYKLSYISSTVIQFFFICLRLWL